MMMTNLMSTIWFTTKQLIVMWRTAIIMRRILLHLTALQRKQWRSLRYVFCFLLYAYFSALFSSDNRIYQCWDYQCWDYQHWDYQGSLNQHSQEKEIDKAQVKEEDQDKEEEKVQGCWDTIYKLTLILWVLILYLQMSVISGIDVFKETHKIIYFLLLLIYMANSILQNPYSNLLHSLKILKTKVDVTILITNKANYFLQKPLKKPLLSWEKKARNEWNKSYKKLCSWRVSVKHIDTVKKKSSYTLTVINKVIYTIQTMFSENFCTQMYFSLQDQLASIYQQFSCEKKSANLTDKSSVSFEELPWCIYRY